ncbi:MAG: hypothetical protein MUE30_14360, partial [Spirosomaceae bacterium]|nr:hypothetical protein [Spirosomataceae bacterium]
MENIEFQMLGGRSQISISREAICMDFGHLMEDLGWISRPKRKDLLFGEDFPFFARTIFLFLPDSNSLLRPTPKEQLNLCKYSETSIQGSRWNKHLV